MKQARTAQEVYELMMTEDMFEGPPIEEVFIEGLYSYERENDDGSRSVGMNLTYEQIVEMFPRVANRERGFRSLYLFRGSGRDQKLTIVRRQ